MARDVWHLQTCILHRDVVVIGLQEIKGLLLHPFSQWVAEVTGPRQTDTT